MRPRNDIRQEKIQRAFDSMKGLEYGTEIPHETLMAIVGAQSKDTEYYSIVNKARDRLVEVGKCTRTLHGVGYLVITPDEYAEESRRQIEHAGTRMNEAEKIISFAPVEKMSPEGFARHRAFADRLSMFRAHMVGVRKELSVLVNQKPLLKLNSGRD